LYRPPSSSWDKGHLYASLGVFPAPAEPPGNPPENHKRLTLRLQMRAMEIGGWKMGEKGDEDCLGRRVLPSFQYGANTICIPQPHIERSPSNESRSSSSCWGPRRNEMQFKCLGYKLLSQQAAGSRSTRTWPRELQGGLMGGMGGL